MSRTYYDPHWLQALVTVAKTGSVSRAAEQLCLSQPALSLQLKALRQAVGVPLFRRHAQGMQLTTAGVALLPHAQHALEGLAQFTHAATDWRDSPQGVLRIGTVVDPIFLRLGVFLQHLNRMAPRVDPQLFHGMSGDALEGVVSGRLDGGFYLGAVQISEQDAGEAAFLKRVDLETVIDWRHLTSLEYRVIAPVDWAEHLAGASWATLMRQPWLQAHDQSVHRRLLLEALRCNGVNMGSVKWVAKVDQESAMLSLVQAGVGLSLMPEWVAVHESQLGHVHMIDCIKLPCVLGFAWRTDTSGRRLSGLLQQALQKTWPESCQPDVQKDERPTTEREPPV